MPHIRFEYPRAVDIEIDANGKPMVTVWTNGGKVHSMTCQPEINATLHEIGGDNKRIHTSLSKSVFPDDMDSEASK